MGHGSSPELKTVLLVSVVSLVFLASLTGAWADNPVISPSILPDGQVGESYSVVFSTDHDACAEWSISGVTPPGLTFVTTDTVGCPPGEGKKAKLSGTPTAEGEYGFTVSATVLHYAEFPFTGDRSYKLKIRESEPEFDFTLEWYLDSVEVNINRVLYRNIPTLELSSINTVIVDKVTPPTQRVRLRMVSIDGIEFRLDTIREYPRFKAELDVAISQNVLPGVYRVEVIGEAEDGSVTRTASFNLILEADDLGNQRVNWVRAQQILFGDWPLIEGKNTIFRVSITSTLPWPITSEICISLPADEWSYVARYRDPINRAWYKQCSDMTINPGEHVYLLDFESGGRLPLGGTNDPNPIQVPVRPRPKGGGATVEAILEPVPIFDEPDNIARTVYFAVDTKGVEYRFVPIVPICEVDNYMRDRAEHIEGMWNDIRASIKYIIDVYPVAEDEVYYYLDERQQVTIDTLAVSSPDVGCAGWNRRMDIWRNNASNPDRDKMPPWANSLLWRTGVELQRLAEENYNARLRSRDVNLQVVGLLYFRWRNMYLNGGWLGATWSSQSNTFFSEYILPSDSIRTLWGIMAHEHLHNLGATPDVYKYGRCRLPADEGFGVNFLGLMPDNGNGFIYMDYDCRGLEWVDNPILTLAINRLTDSWSFGEAFRYWNNTNSSLYGTITLMREVASSHEEVVVIRGALISNDKVALFPLIRTTGAEDTPVDYDDGEYQVILLNSDGDIIRRINFTMIEPAEISGNPTFSLYIKWNDEVTEIRILRNSDGKVLAVKRLSPNPPIVELIYPRTGDRVGREDAANVVITWRGIDPDGDELFYDVWISPDGGDTWIPLAFDWPYERLNIPVTLLEPGHNYKIKIIANDGFRTTEVTSGRFSVVEESNVYSVIVDLLGLPPNVAVKILVDGVEFTEVVTKPTPSILAESIPNQQSIASIALILPKGEHVIEVQKIIDVGPGIRVTIDNNIIEVKESTLIAFVYKTEYLVNVVSEYGETRGSGWYTAGSEAVIEVIPAVVTVDEGVRQLFSGWIGTFELEDPSVAVKVMQPINLHAVWQRQYLVNVVSEYSEVIGAGWYDEGTTANIRLKDSIVEHQAEKGVRFIFSGWIGDVKSGEPQVSFAVDRPKSIAAEWRRQYLLTLLIEPEDATGYSGDGWYDENTDAIIRVDNTVVQLDPETRLVFTGWVGSVTADEPTVRIVMDSPKQVTALFRKQYLLTVESEYEVIGGGWYFEGESAELKAPSRDAEIPGVRIVLDKWEGPVSNPSSPETSVVMSKPATVKALWRTDYTGLVFYIAVAAAVALIAVALSKRKKNQKTEKKD